MTADGLDPKLNSGAGGDAGESARCETKAGKEMDVDLNDNEGDGGRIANQLAYRVTWFVTGYLMWYFLVVTPVAFFSK